jgi:hypothetical protein
MRYGNTYYEDKDESKYVPLLTPESGVFNLIEADR